MAKWSVVVKSDSGEWVRMLAGHCASPAVCQTLTDWFQRKYPDRLFMVVPG